MTTTLGHNQPPPGYQIDLDDLQRGLAERSEEVREIAARRLEEAADAPHPVDDESAGQCDDFVVQLRKTEQAMDALRVGEKAPFMSAEKAVDGYFKPWTDKLKGARDVIAQKALRYRHEKAQAAQREREEQIRQQREEQRRQEEEARRLAAANRPIAAAQAAEAAQATAEAVQVAEVKQTQVQAKDLGRTRGAMGAVGTLSYEWVGAFEDYAVVDLEALRPYLKIDAIKDAIRQHAKRFNPQRGEEPTSIAGVTFTKVPKGTVRG